MITKDSTHPKERVRLTLMSDNNYRGFTEAQKKANAKYLKESVENITLRVPKGKKAIIKEYAKSNGESTNAFINRAIDESMRNSK